MASVKIFIFFSALALGFHIPYQVAARDIGTKSSPGRDEAITNPVITLVTNVDHNLNESNLEDHKSMSFDVYEDNYEDFIQKIRDELKDSDSHGIPVLMPQRPETAENAAWLDIRLVAGDRSITVRLEQSNLYVRGYARSTDDFFWQFAGPNLITGAQNLSFSGSYVEADGVETNAGVGRDELPLGGTQLANAVHELAKMESPHGKNATVAAHSLLVIIQMIAEAARFRPISERISADYWNTGDVTIGTRMAIMENSWVRLSTAVLQTDVNPTPTTPLPNIPNPNPTDVYTFGQALAVLGILVIKKPRGGMATNADYGRSLMNLEYVRVNSIDGEDPGNLYGTVRVDDGWFTYTFYDQSSGNSEKVGPGGFATLTDPSKSFAVSGADAVVINVDLFDHDSLSPDDEIAKGEVVWDSMIESVTFENYDKHLKERVTGEYGDVTVGYSVLSNALGVTIQVLLIDGDGESTAEVYGTLTASQVLGGSAGLIPITLFDKSSSKYVQVRQGDPIPIDREVIAASTSTKLTITADLWDSDPLSPDDDIAQGSVDFTVQQGTQTEDIYGRYGQVQVIITCE